jgi:EAL domain-containing protein (putative c-di-GMP-specific phosphodiesterase class I)
VLQESGQEPGSLILEIIEGTLLEDTEVNETVFKELKALGVRLAIDDFGKKYSSLSYLNRLPVDALKIDRSFLQSFGEDPSNAIIVEAVVSLAHSLGLEVTEEGGGERRAAGDSSGDGVRLRPGIPLGKAAASRRPRHYS